MAVWPEPRIPRSAIISPKQPSRFPSIEKGPRRASYQHIERLLPESLAFYLQGSALHGHTEQLGSRQAIGRKCSSSATLVHSFEISCHRLRHVYQHYHHVRLIVRLSTWRLTARRTRTRRSRTRFTSWLCSRPFKYAAGTWLQGLTTQRLTVESTQSQYEPTNPR